MKKWAFWLGLFCIVLPLLTIFSSFLTLNPSIWQHLYDTVLIDYIVNSLLLACSVAIGTATIGTTLAWCVTRYQFPLRRFIGWSAVLSLAIPAYIGAYTYTGILDYSGPVQTLLREIWPNLSAQDVFQIRSLPGAAVVMTLVLFPYVYLLARNAFMSQPASLYYANAALGKSDFQHFVAVALPLARPAIFAGVMLTVMEALADYGTVAYFGVNTFTTGIFRTWFGFDSQATALQLSGMLLVFVAFCIVAEKNSRKHIYHAAQGAILPAVKLNGPKAWLVTLVCLMPILFGFIIPFSQLALWATRHAGMWQQNDFIDVLFNSFLLAMAAAAVAVLVAILFGYAKRSIKTLPDWSIQLAGMGYALPGVLIAVGLMVPLGQVDRWLNYVSIDWFDYRPGLILSGTLFILLFAYVVRFLAVALNQTQNGFMRITPSMDEAAASMGKTDNQILVSVHLPMMKNYITAATLLVFVDVLKELPATLVLRPFNFNTLAVKTYELAMDERLIDAAFPAVVIVSMGLIPVVMLIRQIRLREASYVAS